MTSSHVMTKFILDTPYDSPTWPAIPPDDQDTILELLCSILTPIGTHRQTHITPSKGKRSKKRKRHDNPPTAVPPLPEIASQILIGFNSIIRHLQTLISTPANPASEDGNQGQEDETAIKTKIPHIAAIFTTNPPLTQSILHSHFPLLVTTASQTHPTHVPIRLVQLPKGCENRLATALSLPRVNFIAVMEEVEGAEVLLGVVREKVGDLSGMKFMGEEAKYLGARIVGVDGPVGKRKGKKGDGDAVISGKKQKVKC